MRCLNEHEILLTLAWNRDGTTTTKRGEEKIYKFVNADRNHKSFSSGTRVQIKFVWNILISSLHLLRNVIHIRAWKWKKKVKKIEIRMNKIRIKSKKSKWKRTISSLFDMKHMLFRSYFYFFFVSTSNLGFVEREKEKKKMCCKSFSFHDN